MTEQQTHSQQGVEIDVNNLQWGLVLFPKLSKVWQSGLGCDVIIICYDGVIQAPAVLLSTLSKKLHQIVLASKDRRLTFRNVSIRSWKDLLSWLYTGSIGRNITEKVVKNVLNILYFAHMLEMKDIVGNARLHHILSSSKLQFTAALNLFKESDLELDKDVKVEYVSISTEKPKSVNFSNSGLQPFKQHVLNVSVASQKSKVNGSAIENLYEALPAGKISRFDGNFASQCMVCGDECEAAQVMCLYCNEEVPRDVGYHMSEEHAHCTNAQQWVYTCDVKKEIIDDNKLIVKAMEFDDDKILKCKICSDVFNRREQMYFHMKSVHKVASVFYCTHCDSGFKVAHARNNHQYLCGGGIKLKCSKCGFYWLFSELQTHECVSQVHHSDEKEEKSLPVKKKRKTICYNCNANCSAKKVRCALCFKIVANDISHMEQDHVYSPKTSNWVYTCKVLTKQTKKSQNKILCTKVAVNETNLFKYQCGKCDQAFENVTDVTGHIKKIHKMNVKMCEICGTGLSEYIDHKDHEHFCRGGDLVNCKICEKRVGCHKSLADHMHVSHPESHKQEQKVPVVKVDILEEDVEEDFGIEAFAGGVCCSCLAECDASEVQCIYCLQVVENNLNHMIACHPYSSGNAEWVYTCNYEPEEENSDHLVCLRELVEENEGNKKNSDSGDQYQYRCIKCNTVFMTKNGVKSHIEDEHEISANICSVCDLGLEDNCQMKDHEHYCKGGKCLRCQVCGETVGTYSFYSQHLIELHPATEICKKIITELKMDDIYRDKVGRKTACFKCGQECKAARVKCMYCFEVVENNRLHMDISHPYTPKTSMWAYTCQIDQNDQTAGTKHVKPMLCFREPRSVDSEEKTKDNSTEPISNSLDDKSYRCSYCDAGFEDIDSALTHLKQDHDIHFKEIQMCEICNSAFMNMSYWKDHFHFCSGGGLLKCDVCEDEIGGYTALDQHQCNGVTVIECGNNQQFQEFVQSNKKQILELNAKSECIEYVSSDMKENMPNETNEMLKGKETVFEEDKTTQIGKYAKRCFTCGDNCDSHSVKCMYCNRVISGDDCVNHMSSDHSNMPRNIIWPVNCTYFNADSVSPIVTHSYLIDGKSIHHCAICGYDFETLLSLSTHTQEQHQFLPQFCYVCNSGFKYSANKQSHEHFCSGGDLLKCMPCGKLVGSWIYANAHYYRAHKPKTTDASKKRKGSDIPVDAPHSVKKVRGQLEFIQDSDHNIVVQTNQSDVPNSQNENNGDINIPKGVELKCKETNCNFQTSDLSEMNSHNKGAHKYKESELSQFCQFCYQMFRAKTVKEKHEQSEHLNGQRIFCELCRRDFEIPSQKEIHIKYFHKITL